MSQPRLKLVSIAVFLLLAYNNCARNELKTKSNQSSLSSTSPSPSPAGSSQCPVSTKPGALRAKVAADLADREVKAGTAIFLLIDNSCFRRNGAQSDLTRLLPLDYQLAEAQHSAASLILPEDWPGARLVAAAEEDPCLDEVDLDQPMKLFQAAPVNDPRYSGQTYLSSIQHNSVYGSLFNAANGINREVRIAIIDSGVDLNHPDLQGLLLKDSAGNLIALNGMNNSRDVQDAGYHGTHVTGIAMAISNNAYGISGVLGASAKLLPIRVSDDGDSVNMSAVVAGVRWAADQGAHVINLSLGGSTDRPSLKSALEYAVSKGSFIVVAAGNDGDRLSTTTPTYPALYSAALHGMITVGSYDVTSGARSSFSNYSSTYVDLLAPGSDGSNGILSTVPIDLTSAGLASKVSSTSSTSSYPIQGTSMATPVATGAAAAAIALALSRGFDATPAQIENLFMKGSDASSAYADFAKGGRKLNLRRLLQTLDADHALDLFSSAPRSQARGQVFLSLLPQHMNVGHGSPAEFTVVVDSTRTSVLHNFRWYKDGVLIASAKTNRLRIDSVSAADSGDYRVEVSAGTEVKSHSVRLNKSASDPTCP